MKMIFFLFTRAVRYLMCIVAQRENAMHDFVDDDTAEKPCTILFKQYSHLYIVLDL